MCVWFSDSFSLTDPHERRTQGDHNALYFFIIAVVSTFCIAIQNYMFGVTAASLTSFNWVPCYPSSRYQVLR